MICHLEDSNVAHIKIVWFCHQNVSLTLVAAYCSSSSQHHTSLVSLLLFSVKTINVICADFYFISCVRLLFCVSHIVGLLQDDYVLNRDRFQVSALEPMAGMCDWLQAPLMKLILSLQLP